MDLVTVPDRSPDGDHLYVGRVLECAWRALPQVYAALTAGSLAPWRAEWVAEAARAYARTSPTTFRSPPTRSRPPPGTGDLARPHLPVPVLNPPGHGLRRRPRTTPRPR